MRGNELAIGWLVGLVLLLAWQLTAAQAGALGPVISNVDVQAYDLNIQPSGAVPGSCGYGAINETSWPFGAVASVTSNDSLVAGLPMSGCGTCFKLQCEDQGNCRSDALPVKVLIVDSCPTCTASVNFLNLPIQRFASLSVQPGATVLATAQQVDCSPPGNIIVRVINNPNYNLLLELVLLDVAGSGIISRVDLKNSLQDDSAWVPMSVYDGAIWQAGDLPPNPINIRITNDVGQQVVARQIYNGGAGGDVLTDVQFPVTAPYPAPNPALSPSALPLRPSASPSGLLLMTPQKPTLRGVRPLPILPEAPSPFPSLPAVAPTPGRGPFPSLPAVAPTPGRGPSPSLPAVAPTPVRGPSPAVGAPAASVTLLADAPGLPGSALPGCPGDTSNLQSRNLSSTLANPEESLTMFAPINTAFNCNVFSGSTSLSATINQIAAASPNSLAALVGGQVVPEYYPTAKLTPGTELNTTDKVKNGNGSTVISVTVDPASVNGPVQVQGVGSVAKVLVPDVQACGPSVLQVTDNFILPFAPNADTTGLNGGSNGGNNGGGADPPLTHASQGPPSVTLLFP